MAASGAAIVMGVGPIEGLGASLACYFAKKGLHVVIAGRSLDKLLAVTDVIQQGNGTATAVVANTCDDGDIKKLFSTVQQQGLPIKLAV